MPKLGSKRILLPAFAAVVVLLPTAAMTQDNYESWPLLQRSFESTGGGGIMIGEYNPVVKGTTCATNFTATEPSGKVYYNIVEFEAVPTQGGVLCTAGKWRSADGSASGTTPLQVFIKDGLARRSPL